ncbi:Pimeloyl-ACP methyl ester carboxylesterase [Microbacterium sp. cf046]|uniref:alpha/beta fold hydrolase n=1 Tax=Microbacterium sp. cf046 TaxID=1761803 RepID=UPI0008E34476|nr:alpha/beta hydrolase [Microbacterium sp. cf046]SFR94700.1 Pimeloyl-ACP methyl ester carboxylesterase [Microbacterium sp. cf046]
MNPFPHPLPLRTDEAALGLRRLVVPTSIGEVAVRTGRDAGGPATILLHGAAGSWTTWTPLIAASDLRGGAGLSDVVAVDLPGWGESGELDRVRTVEDMSDAVVELARALGYSSWHVVGHSLGGFVALDVAARYPDDTLGVTLVSATGTGVLDAIRRPLRGGIGLPWFAGMLLTMRTLAGPPVGGKGVLRRRIRAAGTGLVRLIGRLGWLGALTSPLFAQAVHPSVISAFAEEVRPASFARAARLAADYEERTWTGIRCPVRSVRGARDVFAGEQDAGAFVRLIPDFGEVRLPDAGHFAHVERPDAVLAAMDAVTRADRPLRAAAERPFSAGRASA